MSTVHPGWGAAPAGPARRGAGARASSSSRALVSVPAAGRGGALGRARKRRRPASAGASGRGQSAAGAMRSATGCRVAKPRHWRCHSARPAPRSQVLQAPGTKTCSSTPCCRLKACSHGGDSASRQRALGNPDTPARSQLHHAARRPSAVVRHCGAGAGRDSACVGHAAVHSPQASQRSGSKPSPSSPMHQAWGGQASTQAWHAAPRTRWCTQRSASMDSVGIGMAADDGPSRCNHPAGAARRPPRAE